MSQSPIMQWDPVATLGINEKPDGNFTCSGVKNGTTDACNFQLRGPTAQSIDKVLDEMCFRPRRDAHEFLGDLAKASLCQHHKGQARGKITEWTGTINRLSAAVQPAPAPAPSTPLRANRSPTPQVSDSALEETVRILQEQVDVLTARIASLEVGRAETSNRSSLSRGKGMI